MKKTISIILIMFTLILAACSNNESNTEDPDLETNNQHANETNNNESVNHIDNKDSENLGEQEASEWEVVSEVEELKLFKGNDLYRVREAAIVEHPYVEYEVMASSFTIVDHIDGLDKYVEDNVYLIADATFKNLSEEELSDGKYLMNNIVVPQNVDDQLSHCQCTLDDSKLSVFDMIREVSYGVEGFSGKTLVPDESDSGQMVFEARPAESYDLHFATNEVVESVVYTLSIEDAESFSEDLSTKKEDIDRLAFGEGVDVLIREKEAELMITHPTYKEITDYMNADNVDFDEKVLEFDLQIKNNSNEAIDLNDLLNSIIHFKLVNETGVKKIIHGSIIERNPVDDDGEEMEEIQPGEEGWTKALFDRVRPFEGDFHVFFHEMYPDHLIGKAWEGNHTGIVKEEE